MSADKEDTSSSSDEDSSSDEEMEETPSFDASEIDRLEMQLRAHPYNYEFHELYISALSKAGKAKAEELRAAREEMCKRFPLPEAQWIQWVRDEIPSATSAEDKERVIGIFERGLKDYQSVTLQLSFGSFVESIAFSKSKGGTPDAADIKRVRDTYETGLVSVGLHMSEGQRLWVAYRAFEQRLLASIENQADKNKQIEKVRALYKRQLAVPHDTIEETYADYASWEESQSPPGPNPNTNEALQTQYKNALAAVQERRPYEEAVAGPMSPTNPDYTKLPTWREYLAFEESKGDPSRIQCLYERVLKGYFLAADLWVAYTNYLEKAFPLPKKNLPVYERAVRNCNWSGALWAAYLRTMEKAQLPTGEVEAAFETGIASNLQQETDYAALWEAFVDYKRRQYASLKKSKK